MKKTISAILLIVTCSFTFPGKEISLRYTFKKGDAYEWGQKSNISQHIAVAGTDQNIETVIEALTEMKVTEVIGTSAKFEIEYKKVTLKVKVAGNETVMDSEGDTSKVFNKLMGAMKNKKFSFTLSKNGTVESVDNVDNLWSGFSTLKVDQAQANQIKQSLEQSFGKSSFKKSMEGVLVSYPEHKVQAGSTWKSTSAASATLPIQTDNTWTLESVTEPNAVIVNDGAISTTDTTKIISPQPGIRATASLKGRQVIKCTVSTAHGWPLTSKSYSEIKGKMRLLAGGPIPEDMDLQMEITSETEYLITKK